MSCRTLHTPSRSARQCVSFVDSKSSTNTASAGGRNFGDGGGSRSRGAPADAPTLSTVPHFELAARVRALRRGAMLCLVAAVVLAAVPGCSLRRFAANSVANSLANGPDVFSSDDDPELVRGAVPFGLKTME